MNNYGDFLLVMGAICPASESLTDLIKARWTWLGQPRPHPQEEKLRQRAIVFISAAIAALLATFASVDVFGLLGLEALAGLRASLPWLYTLLNMICVALLASLGAPLLHEVLSILIEFRRNICLRNQMIQWQLLESDPSKDR